MSALLETFLPHRDPTAETTAEPAAPFGHCPTYTKIIKSRLSSRSVQNLWIKKNFDFSRIFIGLTLKPCYTSKYECCFSSNDLTQYFRCFIAEKVWKECWSTECLANSTQEHCKLRGLDMLDDFRNSFWDVPFIKKSFFKMLKVEMI